MRSSTILQLLLPCCLLLFFHSPVWAQDGQTLSFTVTNGAEERCAVDSLVNISIEPNPNLTLTSMNLVWGDGSEPTVIMPDGSFQQSHTYPGESFFEECSYNSECVNLGFQGFCFSITVVARYLNGSTENVSKILTFQVPPRPEFGVSPAVICLNETVRFSNNTCPANDATINYTWKLPDGQELEEEEISQVFSNSGSFPVELVASNACGADSITKNLTVQDLPLAASAIDSGSVSFENNIYRVCLGDGGLVRLNGDSSLLAGSYRWSISSSSGIEWVEGRNQKITRLDFNQPGTYTITLEVDNGCNDPDQTSFQVEVLDSSSLSLSDQPDECLSLTYQPDPLNPDAIYSIDDQEIPLADFPITLTDRDAPYLITALLPNVCGPITRRDTFRVFSPAMPTLISPANDTSLCAADGRFLLQANPPGGRWLANDRVIQEGGQFYFDLSGPSGNFLLTYAFGSGDCERTTDVTISTQLVNVDIGNDLEEICIDADPFALSAMPGGGQWEGTGVGDTPDTFDPAVAGLGTHLLTYRVTDAATGCTLDKEKSFIVQELPSLEIADSTATCLIDKNLDLLSLTNLQVQPGDGTFEWEGVGVTDPAGGAYNPSVFGMPGVDTIRVLYTSPQGCTRSAGTLLKVEDLITAATIPDSTLCLGVETSITLPGMPGGGTWTGEGIDSITGTINLSQFSAGTFAYTYTVQKGTACESAAGTELTFIAGGSVDAGEDLYFCESDNLIALPSGMPGNGNWDGPGLTNGSQVNVQSLGPGAFEFSYASPTLPPACNTDVIQIFVDSIPVADFFPDSVVCIDTPLEVAAAASHGDQWQWDFGNGESSTAPTDTVSYNQPGNVSVTLEVASLHPLSGQVVCENAITKSIFIAEPPPLVDFTVSDTTGCGPLTVLLDNLTQGDLLEYSWQLGNGQTSTEAEPGMLTLPAGIEDTTYLISLMAGNGCGNLNRAINISVSAMPQADFGVDFAEPCSGDTLRINNTSTGNPVSNNWTFSTGLFFDTFNPPIIRPKTDTIPKDIDITLISSNSCGVDTITRMVTVFPTDVRALINISDKTVCVEDTVVLTSFSTPGANLNWNLSNGNTFAQPRIELAFAEEGTYRATLFAERCGYDSTMVEFEVLPLPEIAVSGDFLACEDAPASFALSSNVSEHVLFFGTGDSSRLNQIEYVFDTAGIYNLNAVAASNEGCRNSWAGSVMVEAKPEVDFNFMDSICARTAVQFIREGDPDLACRWRFDGQDPVDDCSPEFVFEESGLHVVQLTLSSATGCRDSLQQLVTVRPTPTADFDIEIIEDCSPASFQFVDQSIDATGLVWGFGDGTSAADQNPEHVFTQPGSYQVQLSASYDGICFQDISKQIEVFSSPQIEIGQEEQCTREEGTDIRITTDIESFVLLSNDTYSEAGDLHPGLAPGTYQVRAESIDGCISREEVIVLPVRELEISLPVDSFFIQLGESVQLEVQANFSSAVFLWDPPETLTDPTAPQTLATPFRTTDYVVTVTDDKGCIQIDTVFVAVEVEREEGIYLPNAFTPDGSGHNDVFRLRVNNPGVEKIKEFRVYDRWGEAVFIAADCEPNTGLCAWDGTFRGQAAAVDVYVFYVEIEFVDGQNKILKGEVNLIR